MLRIAMPQKGWERDENEGSLTLARDNEIRVNEARLDPLTPQHLSKTNLNKKAEERLQNLFGKILPAINN